MPQTSINSPKLNADLAVQARPELEQTVRELQECLNRYSALHDSFRQKFLNLFENSKTNNGAGGQAPPALLNAYFFHHANLAGNALSHLQYAADLSGLACGLLPEPSEFCEK